MQVTQETLNTLSVYLQQTMSPDSNVRRHAEKLLQSTEHERNYALLLLHLVDRQDIDLTVRIAGAITFKNFVRRNWAKHLDDNGPNRIHEDDRTAIKSLIVSLMLRSPLSLQKQLSDAVSIIGRHDFPKKWPQLIDEMVEKFATGDLNVVNGILQTANSLFKRYRFELKSQALWEEIKLVLDRMAKPLTDLLLSLMQLTRSHANNPETLKVIYNSLVLLAKVFLSLNSQDLPEFFEDNMSIWMSTFHQLLTSEIPCLHTVDNEDEGVIERLRSQICENASLYAQKYDEEFTPYIENFVTAVWELLNKTGQEPKYDELVSNALKFLSIVAERNKYRHIFESPEILASICEKVVIPNLDFRPLDEEVFEDTPEEYIRRDIEGSDIETRRRATCDLVKILSVNFEARIISIFGQYLDVLLLKYKENPVQNWRAKDTAIYLVTSLASRDSTEKHGVTQSSRLVPNLPQFCAKHIIPELERQNINELPVLKSAAIKFIMVFCSILEVDTLVACVPQFIRHLPAQSIVVHTYAACAIESLLALRNAQNAYILKIEILAPVTNDIVSGLLHTLTLPGSNENEYVMKALMRTFLVLQSASLPCMALALPGLTHTLSEVSKNPGKPHFNHYLFETLSICIKIVCHTQPTAVTNFEEAFFPVFQNILSQDVLEFVPYVFQMLSLLLEVRESVGDIPEPYWALFPYLLVPTLWDRPGNVSPLIRLITAFVRQGSSKIAAMDKLSALLGIFQKMISSKTNDHEGFYLLENLLVYYPSEELQRNIRDVFTVLFQRLSLSKTTNYVRRIIVFFCFYAAKFGATPLIELVDKVQAHMFGMVVERLFLADLKRVGSEMDRKIVVVGICKMLTECPAMLTQPYIQYWSRLLQALLEMIELPPDKTIVDGEHFFEVDDSPIYQLKFSRLANAQPKQHDFLHDIVDVRKYLVGSLAKIAAFRPNEIPPIFAALNERHKQVLQKYCNIAGITII